MKQLSEIYAELQEYLGRKLTEGEKDWCWIQQRCASWGFTSGVLCAYRQWEDVQGEDAIDGNHAAYWNEHSEREDRNGVKRYLGRPGNPVDWQLIDERESHKYCGIVLCPERTGYTICVAQFPSRGKHRTWLTIAQAEKAILQMASGISLRNAVENVLENKESGNLN